MSRGRGCWNGGVGVGETEIYGNLCGSGEGGLWKRGTFVGGCEWLFSSSSGFKRSAILRLAGI